MNRLLKIKLWGIKEKPDILSLISGFLDLEANIEIAQSLFKQTKYQEVIDTCKEILTTDTNSIEAIKLIAKSFLATKKIEDARLYLNKALANLGSDLVALINKDNASCLLPILSSIPVSLTLILF